MCDPYEDVGPSVTTARVTGSGTRASNGRVTVAPAPHRPLPGVVATPSLSVMTPPPNARRASRRLVPAALAILAASGAWAVPARLAAQLTVLGATVQEHAMAPGAEAGDSVIVRNPTDAPLRARVYLTDYVFTAAGETRYDPPPSHARSNAGWIALPALELTVPPGASVPVRYRLRAPATVGAGSYWSMLMIEGVGEASDASAGALGMQAVVRYGVQVVAHMRDVGAQNATITAPRAVAIAGGTAVEFDLTNTGERAYRPTVSLEVFDSAGVRHGPLQTTRGLLFPGTSLRQRFELPGLPPAALQAVVQVDTGLDETFAARLPLAPVRTPRP